MRATSSREDWQREAHRLELQGKQEQADAVRATILKEIPVPWPVFDEARLRELLVKVFRERLPGSKPRQQLFEYATAYDEPVLAMWLCRGSRISTSARLRPAARDPRPAPS